MRERAQKLRAALREIEAESNTLMASFPRDGAQAAVSQSVGSPRDIEAIEARDSRKT